MTGCLNTDNSTPSEKKFDRCITQQNNKKLTETINEACS